MSDQKVETKQPNDQTQSVEEDYGLKKLTIYTLSISITCLVIAGVWYKKDDIPFAVMYDTTVKFYNTTTDTLSDSYNSVVNKLLDDKSIIQETAILPETKTAPSIESPAVTTKTITEEIIVTTNEIETLTNEVTTIETEATIVEINKAPVSVKIEETTGKVTQVIKIEEVTEPLIESTESIDLTVKEEVSASEAPAIENKVIENQAITETPAVRTVIEKAETLKATPVKDVAATPVINQPSPPEHQAAILQAPRNYAYSAYPYNARTSALTYNKLPRNNMRPDNMRYMNQGYTNQGFINQGYMNQANIIEQQRRTFEQNIQIQQQMMQQAFRMQSAIFKDADMRHQEMLKRAAHWKAESQKRRDVYNTSPLYQPAYMN